MNEIINASKEELMEIYANLIDRRKQIRDKDIDEIAEGKIIIVSQELKLRNFHYDELAGWRKIE